MHSGPKLPDSVIQAGLEVCPMWQVHRGFDEVGGPTGCRVSLDSNQLTAIYCAMRQAERAATEGLSSD